MNTFQELQPRNLGRFTDVQAKPVDWLKNYTEDKRDPYFGTWLHNSKPVWVRCFPPTMKTQMHYRAYKAIERVPAGCDPWTVNNRRIGSDFGFKTLEEAAQAGEEA